MLKGIKRKGCGGGFRCHTSLTSSAMLYSTCKHTCTSTTNIGFSVDKPKGKQLSPTFQLDTLVVFRTYV